MGAAREDGSGGDVAGAVASLRSGWDAAPPEPDLAALLTEPIRWDESAILELVMADLDCRRERGVAVSLGVYQQALGEIEAGSDLAQQILTAELSEHSGGGEAAAAEELIRRYGERYRADVALAAELRKEFAPTAAPAESSQDAALPPTERVEAGHPGASPEPEPGHRWHRGQQLGPYKLLKRLGGGGFGVVWLAERRNPDLLVAIKVLKGDVTDRREVLRFEAEAQALAYLEHPAIATIHDAGVNQAGLPYLVMEYVREGIPLNQYCDQRGLSVEQRLELVTRICEGVHHAHARGLIHRDLKPDNILVTEVRRPPKSLDRRDRQLVVGHEGELAVLPQPKIVDFGLAKAVNPAVRLSDGTISVDLGKMMGTVDYMAPEQAGHGRLEVDTRTDIFALGAILFELLTGMPPLSKELVDVDLRGLEEVVRTLRTQTRPEPADRLAALDEQARAAIAHMRSTSADRLLRMLRGRVRHLIGSALRLEKEKRFTSVAALAQDIHAYLDDRDYQEAAAEPRIDKLLRHLRRHKLPYAAAAVVMLSLIAGIIGTSIAMSRAHVAEGEARRQEAAAVAEQERARNVTDFIKRILASTDPRQVGGQVTARHLLEEAERRMAHEPDLRNAPRSRAEVHEALGDAFTNLDLEYLASKHYEAALAYWSDQPDVESKRLARLQDQLARCYVETGRYAESERLYDAAPQTWLDVKDEGPRKSLQSLRDRVMPLLWLGRPREGKRILDDVLSRQRQLAEHDADYDDDVRATRSTFADWLDRQGKHAEAAEIYGELADEYRRLVEQATDEPDQPLSGTARKHVESVVTVLKSLAYQLTEMDEHRQALALYDQATKMVEQLGYDADHPLRLTLAQSRLGAERDAIKSTVEDEKRLPEALAPVVAQFKSLVDQYQRVMGPDASSTLVATGNYAITLEAAGRREEAIALLEGMLPLAEQTLGPYHTNTLYARTNLAMFLEGEGQLSGALRAMKHTYESYRSISLRHPDLSNATSRFFDLRRRIARESDDREEQYRVMEDELAAWREQIAAWRAIREEPDPRYYLALHRFAKSRVEAGDMETARSLLIEALAGQRRQVGEQASETTESRLLLANVLLKMDELQLP